MRLEQTEEHKGLRLKVPMSLSGKVVAIIGRNGAGKSRLLEAIAEGKINVISEEQTIARDQILHLTTERLQPSVVFGFDPVKYRDEVGLAKVMYRQHRGKFNADPQKAGAALGNIGGHMGRGIQVHVLAHAVVAASRATGKGVNELDDQDVADFYSSAAVMQLGTINVTATMREYLARIDENDLADTRNKKYGQNNLYRTPEEFESRFRSPPWVALNSLLTSVLDGSYHVQPPEIGNDAGYEARLRNKDGKEIDPSVLSSGEKTLLWLLLCMYGATSNRVGRPPRLLLLDEPDATLHPQMIQKLHEALDMMAQEFGCEILFTTHSPTTVALFKGSIYGIAENELTEVDQDAAISELLVGVDQVSIHFSNRRQVYVESHYDAEVYSTLFQLLKQWKMVPSAHISLSFFAAAPKLPRKLIQQILKASVGTLSDEDVNTCAEALNGQGNCDQVIGTVETLSNEGNSTVYGIVDWDTSNKPQTRIHVLGQNIFYSIENAVLNPLTLGLYLLHNFAGKIDLPSYGIEASYDPLSLYTRFELWQPIVDAVTKRVLGVAEVQNEVECKFLQGGAVSFDKRYVHKNGHDLEAMIRGAHAYQFLGKFSKRPSLVLDVVKRGIHPCQGRSLPMAFSDVFGAIQRASQSSLVSS